MQTLFKKIAIASFRPIPKPKNCDTALHLAGTLLILLKLKCCRLHCIQKDTPWRTMKSEK